MRLVPREQDKLMLHYAGMLARDRKAQGLKLNYPEAVAYISMEVMEKQELVRQPLNLCNTAQSFLPLMTSWTAFLK